jgi:CDP-diacylglycerol--serine O-phosphatidyltransferase
MPRPSSRLPLVALLPSMITLLALSCGLFSLRFAVHEQWRPAVVCVIFAAFIDGIDGRVARLLNASSRFGAELDSLADFLNFAVAPALISYLWLTHSVRGVGWGISIFFIMCGAIRLARFNVTAEGEKKEAAPEGEEKPAARKMPFGHFNGMPSPAGGLLCLAPMMLVFFQQERAGHVAYMPEAWQLIVYMAFIAAMMVSNVPTVSLKGLNVPQRYASFVMAAFGALMIAFILEPWIAFPAVGVFYLLTIPVTSVLCGKGRRSPGE